MKITNFNLAILLVLSFLGLFSISYYNSIKMTQSDELLSKYNTIIDNSVEDASKELLDSTDSSSFEIMSNGNKNKGNYETENLNLDKALWRFKKTLFTNLNIDDNYMKQQALMDKIPLKLAVGYDGYYINSWQEVKTDAGNKLEERWGDKINYTMLDQKNNIQINFTLDSYVYVTDLITKATAEGDQSTFISKYPNSIFGSHFNGIRRQVITNLIEKDLTYYTNRNNQIAYENGIGYTFTIPYINDTSINDVSFVAFLQGVPIQGAGEIYNSYGLGIARTAKKHKWYGYTVNGVNYYHSDKYTKTGSNTVIFNSPQAAARAGYYPDPTCN